MDNSNNTLMHIIRLIFRYLSQYAMAAVFIFSGFVKAVDPLGYTYKFTDYFEAFNLPFLSSLSFGLAILMSSVELLIGLNLLFRIRIQITAWALLIFMVFFTILTFILALTNPVTDCGCFGDALILTNWQTFFKNIIFMVPTLVIFVGRKKFAQLYTVKTEWIITSSLFLAGVILSIYCYRNLPLIDFRPYKIGSDIQQSMIIPDGMPMDEYSTKLVYENDGIQKEFELSNAPWRDSTWKWIETKNILIKKGYEPPIHDFSLTSLAGEDVTDQFLADNGYSFLIVSHNLSQADRTGLDSINSLAEKAIQNGYKVYTMTASTSDVIEQTKTRLKPAYEFYTTDEITLKTMIRSNPGLMLIKEGHVLGKWHFRNIPSAKMFEKGGMTYTLQEQLKTKNYYLIAAFILFLALIFVTVRLVYKS